MYEYVRTSTYALPNADELGKTIPLIRKDSLALLYARIQVPPGTLKFDILSYALCFAVLFSSG